MTTPYATINGEPTSLVEVHVAATGPWWADVDCVEAPDLPATGLVSLRVGALTLAGAVDPDAAGTFGMQRRVRVIGGAGGWGRLLPAKAYHSDAGVSALLVAQDAAREAGETIVGFASPSARVGVDYVRQAGPASRALEDVTGGAEWWVNYDGTTTVGTRPTAPAARGAYELVDYDPRHRVALLAVDDLSLVGIGSVLSDRFDVPATVRELVITVTPDSSRVRVWTGESRISRMAGIFRALVDRATDSRLHGLWRYRVVRMSGGELTDGRVELQAISRAAGLPDVLPVSCIPGVPGIWASLTPGSEVAVQFLEGDRTMPRVTHYDGKDRPGFLPGRLLIGAVVDAAGAARAGDSVRVEIPASTVLVPSAVAPYFTPNPLPISLDGTITAGSDLVRVG